VQAADDSGGSRMMVLNSSGKSVTVVRTADADVTIPLVIKDVPLP
jgi:hypothetical protein